MSVFRSLENYYCLLNFATSSRTNKDSSCGLPWLVSDVVSPQVPAASLSGRWLVQSRVHAGGLGGCCCWKMFLWQTAGRPKSHQHQAGRTGGLPVRCASLFPWEARLKFKHKVSSAVGWAQLHWQTLRRLVIKLYMIWLQIWLMRYIDYILWKA